MALDSANLRKLQNLTLKFLAIISLFTKRGNKGESMAQNLGKNLITKLWGGGYYFC